MDGKRHARKRVSSSADDYAIRKQRRRMRRSEIPPNVPGNDWREMADITMFTSNVARRRTVTRSQASLSARNDEVSASVPIKRLDTKRTAFSASSESHINGGAAKESRFPLALSTKSGKRRRPRALHSFDCHRSRWTRTWS